MITIEMVMLATLGFLTAALLALFISPLYRRRVARLTTDKLKRSMPLTEAEIRADKDRLRAEFAIRIHKLETKVEEAAEASGVDTMGAKLRAMALSAFLTALGGTFYAQYFSFIDPALTFGPAVSVEIVIVRPSEPRTTRPSRSVRTTVIPGTASSAASVSGRGCP